MSGTDERTGPETLDLLFREAVASIDAGDVAGLERLLSEHPRLLCERLESPGGWLRDKVDIALDSFFRQPYLLWFVAEDPVRNGKLPGNIAQVARAIIEAAEREGVDSLQDQLDFALRLVAWSWIARQCGVQGELIDVLADAGASLGETITHDALVNGNFAAAGRLVERGAVLTLATALCLGRWNDVARLARTASARDKQVALVLTALNGKAEALTRLLPLGVDLNAYSTDIYTHATALHHAVSSGSPEAVKVLVEAGADLGKKDSAWEGTPLEWAEYYIREGKQQEAGKPYPEIAAYLREQDRQRSEENESVPDRTILWRRLDRPGHEAARLTSRDSSWLLEGTAVFLHEGQPCRLEYLVVCDAEWRTTSGKVTGWVGDRSIDVECSVDGEGKWRLNGAECPAVAGCIDLDLNFSPSTNLLPIRRLNLAVGEESTVRAAWLRFPSFALEPLEQVYRHLDSGLYRYESAGGRFVADLQVSSAGFVTTYPGVWQSEPVET